MIFNPSDSPRTSQVLIGVGDVSFQLHSGQLRALAQLADDAFAWDRRNRYGRHRPGGWLTAYQRQRRAASPLATCACEGWQQPDASPAAAAAPAAAASSLSGSSGHAAGSAAGGGVWGGGGVGYGGSGGDGRTHGAGQQRIWADVWRYAISATLQVWQMPLHCVILTAFLFDLQ